MPRLPLLLAASLAVLLSMTLAGPVTASSALGATPAPAAASASGGASRYGAEAEQATNAERAARGRADLSHSRCLKGFAKRQARRMAAQRRIFHQSLGPVLRRCGLDRAGENVAVGFPDGAAVVAGWMASPGHRRNILRRSFTQQAIVARRAGGRWYVAQVFGRRR